MTLIQAVILGAVQGLTEFIPVSSSAHLVIVPWLFGWTAIVADAGVNQTFDVALHVGTFFATLIFFRVEAWSLIRSLVATLTKRRIETFDEKLAWFLIVASIPAAALGAIFDDLIAESLGEPWIMAITLSVFGVAMLLIDRASSNARTLESVGIVDSVVIGVAQAIALVPGTSRSGVTLTAGIYRGLTREAAVRFSFLMALPVIGGAALYKMTGLAIDGLPDSIGPDAFAVGIVTSFVFGYAAIAWLLKFLRTGTLTPFVVYRIALAALIVGLIAAGVRPATI